MNRQRQRGFTVIEAMIAMGILSVALSGLALSIPVAIQANNRNRVDTQATMIAQRELEQFIARPVASGSFTDVDGNSVTISAGGAPLASGKIDFSQTAVSGYSVTKTAGNGARFDLRWNVQVLADGTKIFVIGARRVGSQRFLLPPVNLTTRMGRLI
jgi:prepilin-type N-terminal cleavage/methylation domain-containing protein